uniref:Cell division protein ZapB n=1 Tax=Parastrongyloides trichosuri TaxID=131310 RepID=A0A0N4ZHK4_PARTI
MMLEHIEDFRNDLNKLVQCVEKLRERADKLHDENKELKRYICDLKKENFLYEETLAENKLLKEKILMLQQTKENQSQNRSE